MAQQQMVKEERSLGELLGELAGETGTLVRQEVALAQVELAQTATAAGKNIGFLAVGGAVAFIAALAFTAAIILLLSQFMPAWASALVVGAIVGVIAFFMTSAALGKLRKTDPMPRATIEMLKEDAKWLKKEMT
ncbi:MAG: phage holin family protein [Pyrinomonadaceae bacterium]